MQKKTKTETLQEWLERINPNHIINIDRTWELDNKWIVDYEIDKCTMDSKIVPDGIIGITD